MAAHQEYTPSVSRAVAGSEPALSDTGCSKSLREIGHLAVWSVSSAKAGNGVDALRDGRKDTFWQSDGVQPHLVNIQFQQRMDLVELQVILDYKADESYTPSKISIRAGTTVHDLRVRGINMQEVRVIDLEEPNGCIRVSLDSTPDGQERPADGPYEGTALRAFFLQVAVLANHQNGRDTHIRLVRVFGPRVQPQSAAGLSLPCTICTPEFAMYAAVR